MTLLFLFVSSSPLILAQMDSDIKGNFQLALGQILLFPLAVFPLSPESSENSCIQKRLWAKSHAGIFLWSYISNRFHMVNSTLTAVS